MNFHYYNNSNKSTWHYWPFQQLHLAQTGMFIYCAYKILCMLYKAHIHERNKDIFVRIRAISALGPSVYGPFCEVHLSPFTRTDEKDRPTK